MPPILPARLDWPSAIGNFILNFGALDYLVLEFLESRLPAEQFAKTKEKHFQDRILLIKDCVSRSDLSREKKERFGKFFDRLDPIRELRNRIAHGHLLVRLIEKTEDFVVTLSLPKNLDAIYSPASQHLEFAELQNALDGLRELIEEFKQLANYVAQDMK